MKNLKHIIFCLIILPQIVLGQDDSLLNARIQKLTKYYQDVKSLSDEIDKANTNIESYLHSHYLVYPKLESLKIEPTDDSDKKPDWRSFIPNLIVAVIGAFVGGFIAVRIFYVQIKRDNQKELSRKRKEQEQNIFYLSSLIEATLSKVEEQRSAIKAFYDKVDSNPIILPLMSIIPMQDLKRLAKSLERDIYYYSFIEEFGKEKEVIEKFRQITVSVDYLDSAIIQMNDISMKIVQFDFERKLKFKETFDKGMKKARSCAEAYKISNLSFSSAINYFLDEYKSASPEEQSDFEFIRYRYVSPFRGELFKSFRSIADAKEIISELDELVTLYSYIERNNIENVKAFKEFYTNFGEALLKIDDNSKELRAKKALSFI